MNETETSDVFKSRSGHLGYLSRLYGEVATLTSEPCNAVKVRDYIRRIKTQFDKYCEVYQQCLERTDPQNMESLTSAHEKAKEDYVTNEKRMQAISDAIAAKNNGDKDSDATELYNPDENNDTSVKSTGARSRTSSTVSGRSSALEVSAKEASIKRTVAELKLKHAREAEQKKLEAERKKQDAERRKQEAERMQHQAESEERLQAAQHEYDECALEAKLYEEAVADELLDDEPASESDDDFMDTTDQMQEAAVDEGKEREANETLHGQDRPVRSPTTPIKSHEDSIADRNQSQQSTATQRDHTVLAKPQGVTVQQSATGKDQIKPRSPKTANNKKSSPQMQETQSYLQRQNRKDASKGSMSRTKTTVSHPQPLDPTVSSFVPDGTDSWKNVLAAYSSGVYQNNQQPTNQKQANPEYQRPLVGYQPPPIDYQQPAVSYQLHPETNQRPFVGYQPPPARFQHPSSGFQQHHGSYRQPVNSFPPPRGNSASPQMQIDQRQNDIMTQMLTASQLPKPELLSFDGEPKEYQTFITNFMTNVASVVDDPTKKLTYLIQHCTGKAKEVIKNCILLPKAQQFDTAVSLLQKNFGQNHTIARSYIDSLVNGSQVRSNDVDALIQLSRDMTNCEIVLKQLSFTSDLNSTETMRNIVRRLPAHLQTKWTEEAFKITRKNREPHFGDLCTFVEEKAEVANSMYGRQYAEDCKTRTNRITAVRAQYKTSTLSTQIEEEAAEEFESEDEYEELYSTFAVERKDALCDFCKMKNHDVHKCFKLKQKPVDTRLKFFKDSRLCFRCAKTGHGSKDCNATCETCGMRHHVMLHDEARIKKAQSFAENNEEKNDQDVTVHSTSTVIKSRIGLGILPVIIQGRGIQVKTYALVDSGSNTSLCKRELLDQLKIEGSSASFSVQTITESKTLKNQRQASIKLLDIDSTEEVDLNILTVDKIPVSLKCLPKPESLKAWSHLGDVEMPSIDSNEVGVLIGTDCPEMFWTLEERRGGKRDPVARRTPLGWIVVGPITSSEASTELECEVNLIKVDTLQEQLNRQWNADFQDLTQEKEEWSQEDKIAFKSMEDSVEMIGGKYHLSIPWKEDPKQLPNNKAVAQARLNHLRKKLTQDEDLRVQYRDTVEKYIKDGHARKLSDDETSNQQSVWYLPHHPVFKKSDPNKCRVVFDCAAKYRGTSLNDIILQGPNLINSLAGVLMRFRNERIAVVADIEAMFHQCKVKPPDHQFLRFLWWEDGNLEKPASEYCMLVHLFGATSSPSVAGFCVKKTADDNERDHSQLAVNTLRRSFYVDDMLASAKSVEEAKSLVCEMKELLNKGGFNLTKWASSHREVLSEIPKEQRSKAIKAININEEELPAEPALGLLWNIEDDCFTFNISIKEKPMTRRGLLSMTSSLYDPLGLVCPVTLIPKMIQQELCRSQLDWDDAISDEQANKFTIWLDTLKSIEEPKIPRCYKESISDNDIKAELHVFCDASEDAYGAVAYLKNEESSQSEVSLVMGKSRVAPLKTMTIPRLELTAAALAVKLYCFIKDEIDVQVDKTFFWTDSMITLRYIQNTDKRFKTFVANRVEIIREATHVTDWRYVPTTMNPADLASRGIKPEETDKLERWLKGPEFLRQQTDYAEISNAAPDVDLTEELEVKQLHATEAETVDINAWIERFSCRNKLLRSVAWLIKFNEYLKQKKRNKDNLTVEKQLSVQDIKTAELKVIRCMQRDVFAAEIRSLLDKRSVSSTSPLYNLCVTYEDNLIKVGGRLQDTKMNIEKHPIVLGQHQLTDMIIRHCHESNGHVGVNHCLSLLQNDYYILKGYSNVKRVVTGCLQCKRQKKKPCQQQMAPLPQERTDFENPPFTSVGVDYFGPLMVKHGRGTAKRYGCIFSCLSTRAVHIEISHSMDSDSFLMALHRFIARRGKPAKIFSDNGRNFVGAEKELRQAIKELNSKKVNDALLIEAIEWHFIPPHAPHMGGVWERLVRSVKTVLKSLVKQELLTDEQLVSFVCEVEKVLNDRPLTVVSSDPRDATPITPNHLLLLKGNSSGPTTATNYVKRRWEVIHKIANRFYSRYIREYLPLLQQRPKWQKEQENIRVNDIVLVVDENLPRGQWPLGLVVEVKQGRDDLVRSVMVKVGNNVKTRPITKLVHLEHHD